MLYTRPLETIEVFEEGKVNRVLPSDIKAIGSYTFRLAHAPGGPVPATDMAVVVTDVRENRGGTDVRYICQPIGTVDREFVQITSHLNTDGLVYGVHPGPDQKEVVGLAYFTEPAADFFLTLGTVAASGYQPAGVPPTS